jgi:hypothetical protein
MYSKCNLKKLINTYNQARSCMLQMEERLVKRERTDEFIALFQDNVD